MIFCHQIIEEHVYRHQKYQIVQENWYNMEGIISEIYNFVNQNKVVHDKIYFHYYKYALDFLQKLEILRYMESISLFKKSGVQVCWNGS